VSIIKIENDYNLRRIPLHPDMPGEKKRTEQLLPAKRKNRTTLCCRRLVKCRLSGGKFPQRKPLSHPNLHEHKAPQQARKHTRSHTQARTDKKNPHNTDNRQVKSETENTLQADAEIKSTSNQTLLTPWKHTRSIHQASGATGRNTESWVMISARMTSISRAGDLASFLKFLLFLSFQMFHQ
jgi:hypothetical protein